MVATVLGIVIATVSMGCGGNYYGMWILCQLKVVVTVVECGSNRVM